MFAQDQESLSNTELEEPNVLLHACNPGTQETETGELPVLS